MVKRNENAYGTRVLKYQISAIDLKKYIFKD